MVGKIPLPTLCPSLFPFYPPHLLYRKYIKGRYVFYYYDCFFIGPMTLPTVTPAHPPPNKKRTFPKLNSHSRMRDNMTLPVLQLNSRDACTHHHVPCCPTEYGKDENDKIMSSVRFHFTHTNSHR